MCRLGSTVYIYSIYGGIIQMGRHSFRPEENSHGFHPAFQLRLKAALLIQPALHLCRQCRLNKDSDGFQRIFTEDV